MSPCSTLPRWGSRPRRWSPFRSTPDKVDEVAEALAALDEINWVAETTGSFDVFAWATLESAATLGVFLRTKVGVIPGVRRSETFVNLAVKKRWHGAPVST